MTDSVLTIGLAPTFQKVLVFPSFRENEVNRSAVHTSCASGKAINVTRVLTKLGRNAVNITQLGGARVDEFVSLCRAEGITIRYFLSKAETRTCTTLINEEKGTSTELVEEANEVEAEASGKLFTLFKEEEEKHAAIIISGTKAKGYSDTLIPDIVRSCTGKGKLTVLDIKGTDLLESLPARPTIIKPNLSEFCSTFNIALNVLEGNENRDTEKAVLDKMHELYEEYGVMSVITRGKWPTWCFDGKKFSTIENTLTLPVVNTVGCGDTLTGVMTHHLLNGDTIEESVRIGMEAATRKASHRTFDF